MDCLFADPPLMVRPLPDLTAWTAHFQATSIPVLASSAEALEGMRQREDDVDANLIGETIAGDPLMTLRVLAFAAANRPPRMVTDTGTVTAAIVMMGIGPFFRAFGTLPTVEDRLAAQDGALEGVQAVLRRSNRAATFALAFAVHRMDPDTPLIHQAALLHDFAELLLWCHAPALALELRDRQRREPTLRSAIAQRAVLGVELADLQLALTRTWRLHDLLDAVEGPPLVLALDGVTDPHNLGACLRVADGAGVHAVVAPKDHAVGLNATVAKVASGAAETVPYLMVTNLARSLNELKERDIRIVGTSDDAPITLYEADLKGPLALVLGAEGKGMRQLTRKTCDLLVRIPMLGAVESLNVSVAAGVCLYEARRQRGG